MGAVIVVAGEDLVEDGEILFVEVGTALAADDLVRRLELLQVLVRRQIVALRLQEIHYHQSQHQNTPNHNTKLKTIS